MYIVCFCVEMCTCDGGALTDQKSTSHFLQVESQVVVGCPVWCCELRSLERAVCTLNIRAVPPAPRFKRKRKPGGSLVGQKISCHRVNAGETTVMGVSDICPVSQFTSRKERGKKERGKEDPRESKNLHFA